MFIKVLVLALAATPLVVAHGKIAVVVRSISTLSITNILPTRPPPSAHPILTSPRSGNAGGNGTALGILGGVVPGPGPNRVTEVDTTVFNKVDIATDGLGRTEGGGKNTVADLVNAMAQSGETLPQVSSANGTISGVFHIVTTDGAGPVRAVLDPTATGAFSTGVELAVTQQVPGKKGNIRPGNDKRDLWTRAVDILLKRASNVNEDYPMEFAVPAGTTCTGTVNGQSNVCLVKIANANKAGPFGGVVAVQMVDAAAAPATKRDMRRRERRITA